jgi:hypothetical protein
MFNKNKYPGIAPELRKILDEIHLPIIRGTWFIVDPYGLYNEEIAGMTVPDLRTAYDLCTSGKGDGILVMSGGTTAAHTTSDMNSNLTWSKHNITVVGVGAPTKQFQRARICSKQRTSISNYLAFPTATTITDTAEGFITAGFRVGDILRIAGTGSGTNNGTGHIITAVTAGTITCAASTFTVQTITETGTSAVLTTYCTSVITVSGNNNRFYNLLIINEDTDALALNALKVTGARNYFENVHAGTGVADANSTITYSLHLSAAEENTFVGCTFGLDTVDRGGVATYDILLSGAVARNEFYGCRTTRQSTTGTGCLAVYASSTTGGRPTLFKDCIFTCWNTAGGNANCSYMFGSTGNCDFVWFVNCFYPGYAALSNDAVAWISSSYSANVGSGIMYT